MSEFGKGTDMEVLAADLRGRPIPNLGPSKKEREEVIKLLRAANSFMQTLQPKTGI